MIAISPWSNFFCDTQKICLFYFWNLRLPCCQVPPYHPGYFPSIAVFVLRKSFSLHGVGWILI